MTFLNVIFILFFIPVFWVPYFFVSEKRKNTVLLVGSLVFCAFFGVPFFALLLAGATFNYAASRVIERCKGKGRIKMVLYVLVIDLIFLAVSEFVPKAEGTTYRITSVMFGFMFVKMADYIIQVAKGMRSEKSLSRFLSFALYFPTLYAGPLLKYETFITTCAERKNDGRALIFGFARFMAGMFKLILFASVSRFVFDQAREIPIKEISVLTAWMTCVAFGFWIYFAFSGYSDMASGLSGMLGMPLKKDFRYPLTATGIGSFFKKWNSSFASWAGEHFGPVFTGLFIGFVYERSLSALLWGLILGVFFFLEQRLRDILKKIPGVIRRLFTFLFLTLSWVFLFTDSPIQAGRFLGILFGVRASGLADRRGLGLLAGYLVLWIVLVLWCTPIPEKIYHFACEHLGKVRKKKWQLTMVGVFAAFCLCNAIIGGGRTKITASEWLGGQAAVKWESSEEDALLGRQGLMWMRVKWNLAMGKRISNGIEKGRKNQLFEQPVQAEQTALDRKIKTIADLVTAYPAVKVNLMVVPDAATIVKSSIPQFSMLEGQENELTQIREKIGKEVNWIDASTALKGHGKEVLYYRTAPYWTSQGAFYGYKALAEGMALDPEKERVFEPYAVTADFNGSLSKTSGFERSYREPIYIYVEKDRKNAVKTVVDYVNEDERTASLYDETKLDGKDPYQVFLGGDFAELRIRTTAGAGANTAAVQATAPKTERLLLIKDGYANAVIPFLVPYYREIIVIDPRYYEGDIGMIMEEEKVTSVLFLYGCNEFMREESLEGVLNINAAQ